MSNWSSWLVRNDEDEAVFRKPLAMRLLFGAFLVVILCLLWVCIVASYKGTPTDRDRLPLDIISPFVFILPLSFLAGPMEMRFDFRRKRYRSKMSFAFLTWTRAGNFSEISNLAIWKGHSGLTVAWKEAEALAENLAAKLGVWAEAGGQRGRKRQIT